MLQLLVMTKIWNTWAENVVEDEQEKFAEVIPSFYFQFKFFICVPCK